MSEAAEEVREAVSQAMNEEGGDQESAGSEPEYSETELEALDIGWRPDKEDKDGESLSAEEFIARKPLFNKIRNQGDQIAQMQKTLKEIKDDSKKIAAASIKEKETLLDQLKSAKEAALENLETDEVRKLDKQIDSVREEISQPVNEDYISPHYAGFLEKNEWANDENSLMYHAGMSLASKYAKEHDVKPGDDKVMYDYIHEEMRKEFPDKFKEPEKRASKVGSSKTRATSSYKKQGMTLNDIADEGSREVVKNMARQTGKTVEEYLKNYTPDDFR